MASNKKNPAAPAQTAPAAVAKAAPARAKTARTPAAKPPAVKKPAAAKPAATKPAAAKPLDPAVQASKEALAKALAAAQAVKITKPLGKPAKAKKAKLVRDSFTMPEGEYEQIAALKKRLLGKGVVAKKSELLRAGVAMLVGLSDGELTAAMQKVEVIKTGRPAKSGK